MPKVDDPYSQQRPKVTPPQIGLADLRKSHKLTQANVAEQVAAIIDGEFYSGSLSLIEKGHRGASAEVLRALEQVFGLAEGAVAVDYTPSHSRRKIEGLSA
ncbi:MAG: helix-turn-helix domain-containing protein [Mycobacteriaceae bacterium]